MSNTCTECGYNAGENGEKMLQLHMSTAHGKDAPRSRRPEQLALWRQEHDILIAQTALLLGGIVTIVGLAMVIYGSNTFSILTCRVSPCFIPQSLIDQIRTSGFASVYLGAQETIYAGFLVFTIGFMGVVYWASRRLGFAPRIQLVLLVGIFMLTLVTSLAIAGGIIPFGQRINPPTG